MQLQAMRNPTPIGSLWRHRGWLWWMAAVTILALVSYRLIPSWALNQTLLQFLHEDAPASLEATLRAHPRVSWLEGEKGFVLTDPTTHARALSLWAEQPDWNARMLHAQALAAEDEPAMALQWLKLALQLRPDFLAAVDYAGTLANRRADWHQAVRYWEQAQRLAPASAKPYTNLGMAYYRLGNHAAARQHLRKGIELDPLGWEANHSYLIFLREVGPLDEYATELERVRAFTPEAVVYHYWGGELALRQSKYAEAEQEFTYVLEQRPDWYIVAETLAQLYLETERPQLAARWYHYVLEYNPDQVRYHIGYLWAVRAAGDLRAEKRHLCDMQQAQPEIYQEVRLQLNLAEPICHN
ncbi:MAG: hypothetical protein DCC55_20710 [Chloroflexi bacterium]|nr:MAG: hypothetical protein DCC55_20710 [Chloroflexota bacterium]